MADYYLAPSLVSLRNEINAAHPNRDKTSDGWIGDASHAARVSDHNPDWSSGGVVRAIDVDKDGINTDELLRVACADARTEYVIWNRRIYTRNNGFRAAVYNGANPHDKHMHVSLRHTKTAEKSGRWGYGGGSATSTGGKSVQEIAREVLDGHWGNNPERGQRLAAAGYNVSEVQAEVNRILGGGAGGRVVRLSVAALADQVIRNQWGSGAERVRRLTAAGYDAAAVQAEVNRRLR